MKMNQRQFLGETEASASFEEAQVVIIPLPYEGGVSWGKGTAEAPDAVLAASEYLELYDEELRAELNKIGIYTIEAPVIPQQHEEMTQAVYRAVKTVLVQNKFPVSIGGDHSVTAGCFQAFREKYGEISVIQFDAHADLRDSYEGSKLSHACVMARLQEMTPNSLQIGIRSISKEEAESADWDSIGTIRRIRNKTFDLEKQIKKLPDPVYITFDADVFDWSVIRSTGTPEPGGMTWDEAVDILQIIFKNREVAGFDVVELIGDDNDRNSAFAIAKLIYKMIGMKFFG